MSWITVESCLPHAFVDVCELLVRRPWALLEPFEPRPDGVARLERRLRGSRRVRGMRVDVRPEPLEVESPSRATLVARWRSSHPRTGLGTGRALLHVDSMSKREARTQVTLTIERHRGVVSILSLTTWRFNGLVYTENRRLADTINRAMESDPMYDDDIWLTLLDADDVGNHAP